MDRGAWRATVHRVTKSQTQLKQLNTTIRCVSVDLSRSGITSVPLVGGGEGEMLIMGEAVDWGAGGIREISVPTSQFCCEPKTPLRNEVLKKKKERRREDSSPPGRARRGRGMALQLPLILTMCGVLGGQAGHFITPCLRKCLPALHLPF